MTADDIDEAKAVLGRMMTAVSSVLGVATGKPAADLYYAVGDLVASADTMLRTGQMGAALQAVFDLAFRAGATASQMEVVRLAMAAEAPAGLPAIALANAGIRLALAEEVAILAAATFASRQAIDAAISQVNDGFDQAEEYAADHQDPSTYQALIAAHAASIRDLTTRSRPLPLLITYRFARVLTSHVLAQRLYADASRCDELRAENDVIHPGFMPITGVALTA